MANGFNEDDARALASVLDQIVPSSGDGRLPGAGEAGLVDYIAKAIEQSPDLAPAIEEGLAALAELSREHGAAFPELTDEQKTAVMAELGTKAPAFLGGLTYQTYVGYYQHPRVLEGLGVPGRPPHPEGYELETGDLSLLDPVRARPKLYRE